uniref:Uncharacterized protein n=1 Tax=Anguilla anguilla TaxID=7936 RepID=A0A0E9R532_ANGAN
MNTYQRKPEDLPGEPRLCFPSVQAHLRPARFSVQERLLLPSERVRGPGRSVLGGQREDAPAAL